MSAPAIKLSHSPEPRIGEVSAAQPLSGVSRVEASFAVHGLGHGGFIRAEKTEKSGSGK